MTGNGLVSARYGPELCVVLAVLLAGCCPEVKGADGGGTASVDGLAGGGARFSVIQKELFDRHCVKDCHEATNAAADLRLSPDKSYQNLINVASQQIASQIRVLPGDPERSYLVKKLEGGVGIYGRQMPRLAPARPQAEIDRVRTWITRGAPND
jgi:hypothetical protein